MELMLLPHVFTPTFLCTAKQALAKALKQPRIDMVHHVLVCNTAISSYKRKKCSLNAFRDLTSCHTNTTGRHECKLAGQKRR